MPNDKHNDEVLSIFAKLKTDPEGAKAEWERHTAELRAEAEAEAHKRRQEAFTKTVEELRVMRDMLRGLELPMDQLPLALQIYRETLHPAVPREPMRSLRVPMPVRSNGKIGPDKLAMVIARPKFCALRVEEIEILGNPSHWMVHDIKVGNRSQFAVSGDVPGRLFGPDGTCKKFVTEAIQTAQDFNMVVSYIGPNPEGEVFEATCMGTAAIY